MAGRPTKFKKEYIHQAFVACRVGGFSDGSLAELFSVSEATIANWKNDYPEFLESIQKGKDIFDTKGVENALLKRALGFEYQEVNTVLGKDGKPIKEKTKITKKQALPDTGAIAFWLKNRKSKRWMDRRDVTLAGDKDRPLDNKIEVVFIDGEKSDSDS